MRILGIDPGLAIVGFGLIEAETGKMQMLQYGAVTTPAGLPLAARLVQLERDMEELIAQLRPEAIAVEELFFSNNITTGIAVAHARGIILCTAAKSGIPLFEYTPMQVKQAVVGYGLAEKRQVMDMVRRLLKLKAVPRPDDAADALHNKRRLMKGFAFAIATGCFWALSAPMTKLVIITSGLGPVEVTFYRSFAFLVISIVARIVTVKYRTTATIPLRSVRPAAAMYFAAAAFIGLCLGSIVYAACLVVMPVAIVTAITATSPLIAALFGHFALKERLLKLQWTGIVLIIAGSVAVGI